MIRDGATDPIPAEDKDSVARTGITWIAPASILCALLLGGGFWFSQSSGGFLTKETAEGITYFLDQAEQLTEAQSAMSADGSPQPIDMDFAAHPEATGSMAVFQQFMAGILNESAALTNEYAAELEGIGWSGIMDPNRLEADVGFAETRRLLEDGRRIVKKYEALSVQILRDSEDRIQELDLTPAEKRGFAQGFTQGVASSMAMHQEVWALEGATIDEFGKLIDFLAQEPRFWTADDGLFMFDTQQQVDQFNGYLAKINSLVQRQMELKKDTLDAQREKLGAL